MRILAIDPGNTQSAWVLIDADTYAPLAFAKQDNTTIRDHLRWGAFEQADTVAVEMIAAYGMSVGADVFETCVWIGRFVELFAPTGGVELVERHPIKLHHCRSAKANDTNIRQALVDRFAPGERNHGKGVKAAPGFFYGFAADCWQAYALAVYLADTLTGQADTA